MCLGLGLFERLSGQTAARKSSQRAAKRQETNAILSAEATQNQLETNIAQQQAAEAAKELLSVPIEDTSVSVGDATAAGTVDETTGRRTATRSRFQMSSNSGLVIP